MGRKRKSKKNEQSNSNSTENESKQPSGKHQNKNSEKLNDSKKEKHQPSQVSQQHSGKLSESSAPPQQAAAAMKDIKDCDRRLVNNTDNSNKPTANNEVKNASNKNEKSVNKNKVDVTSIVTELSQHVKIIAPAVSNDNKSGQNEKMVQIKNENNKSGDDQKDKKMVYKKDQWSPANKSGKKVYDISFLYTLKDNPLSTKSPEHIMLNVADLSDKLFVRDQRSGSNRQGDSFVPSFAKSNSTRGMPLPKRGSQSGGKVPNKAKQNFISLSLKEDVKLHKVDNAWKPFRNQESVTSDEELANIEKLKRKARGILNKLTPEKFSILLDKFKELEFSSKERLEAVIKLVFEKAVDEPNFSRTYARLCKELCAELVSDEFRKKIIGKCQTEFEDKMKKNEYEMQEKREKVEKIADAEEKKEAFLQLEEENRKYRMKSVGNVIFIGELYLQDMLQAKTLMKCVKDLLNPKLEERLECLCKLLITVGSKLEGNADLTETFKNLASIANKKEKISSRVRFMILDIIDLRKRKWVPKRPGANPTTMDQCQKDHNEQSTYMVNNFAAPRSNDERLSRDGDKKRRNTNEDGWSTTPYRNSRTAQYSVESAKLKNKPPPMEEIQLGSRSHFQTWGRGSGVKAQPPSAAVTNTNMYAALENIGTGGFDQGRPNMPAKSSASANKSGYSSKGSSVERYSSKQSSYDGRNSRSTSQQRSNSTASNSAPAAPSEAPKELPADIKLTLKNILMDFVSDPTKPNVSMDEIARFIGLDKNTTTIYELILLVFDNTALEQNKCGKLLSYAIKENIFTVQELCDALDSVFEVVADLIIDIPLLGVYLAAVLGPLIMEETFSFTDLRKCGDNLISQEFAGKLLAPLISLVVKDKGPSFMESAWVSSGLSFTDFMTSEAAEDFIKSNGFEFLIGGSGTPAIQGNLSLDQIRNKLLEFFRSNTPIDDVFKWISANVGDRVQDKLFVRNLMTAICENAVAQITSGNGITYRLKQDVFASHYPLLKRYVDNQEEYELQCLFAVQSLVKKWEYPQGLLLQFFEKLHEDDILSAESFFAWEVATDPSEQEGKGVALKQLTSLFTVLKEALDESSGEDEKVIEEKVN